MKQLTAKQVKVVLNAMIMYEKFSQKTIRDGDDLLTIEGLSPSVKSELEKCQKELKDNQIETQSIIEYLQT